MNHNFWAVFCWCIPCSRGVNSGIKDCALYSVLVTFNSSERLFVVPHGGSWKELYPFPIFSYTAYCSHSWPERLRISYGARYKATIISTLSVLYNNQHFLEEGEVWGGGGGAGGGQERSCWSLTSGRKGRCTFKFRAKHLKLEQPFGNNLNNIVEKFARYLRDDHKGTWMHSYWM